MDLYWIAPVDPDRAERVLVPAWAPHIDEAAPIIVGKREIWSTEPAHDFAFPEAETAEPGEQRDFYRRAIRYGRPSR